MAVTLDAMHIAMSCKPVNRASKGGASFVLNSKRRGRVTRLSWQSTYASTGCVLDADAAYSHSLSCLAAFKHANSTYIRRVQLLAELEFCLSPNAFNRFCIQKQKWCGGWVTTEPLLMSTVAAANAFWACMCPFCVCANAQVKCEQDACRNQHLHYPHVPSTARKLV